MSEPGPARSLRGALTGALQTGWVIVLPLVAVALAYRTSPRFGLVADAVPLIVDNASMREVRNLWAMVTHDYFWSPAMGGIGYWRPLTKASWLVENVVGGGAPALFHIVQVTWLLVAVAGVFALARALGLRPAAAAVASVIFGLHPALIEPVCLVMARSDVVASAGMVWSLVGWLSWRRRGSVGGLAIHVGAMVVALASKEVAVTLVPAVALWAAADAFLEGRGPGRGSFGRALAALVATAPAALVLLAYLAARSRIIDAGGTELVFDPLRVAVSLARYLWASLPLTFESVVRNVPIAEARSLASLVGAIAAGGTWLGLLVLFGRRRRWDVCMLLVFAPLTLGPVVIVADANVPGVEDKLALADRWMMPALAAMSVVWVSVVDLFASPRLERWGAALVAIWVLGAIALAPRTHGYYESGLALLSLEDRDLEATPERFRTTEDLCRAHMRALIRAAASDDVGAAFAAHGEAAALECPRRELDLNLLSLLVRQRRWSEAAPIAELLAADPPTDRAGYRARYLIGLALLRVDRPLDATPWLEQATESAAVGCPANLALADAYESVGRSLESADRFERTADCLAAVGDLGAGPVLVRAAELYAAGGSGDEARRIAARAATMPLPDRWRSRLDAIAAQVPSGSEPPGEEP